MQIVKTEIIVISHPTCGKIRTTIITGDDDFWTIEEIRAFLNQVFEDQGDNNSASALAHVILAGNPGLLQKLKVDAGMYKVLEEFYNPKFKVWRCYVNP